MPPVLVFDGGCVFCSAFAQLSELKSGIPDLQIMDGRSNHQLRHDLAVQGAPLSQGAVLINEHGQLFHGADAIQWLCQRMQPSDALLSALAPLMAEKRRAGLIYPWLLTARRLALMTRGLPLDPDQSQRKATS